MISPYVRRLRLARELQGLRDDRRMSAEQLARAVGVPRQRISGIENCHVGPADDEMVHMLDALGVTDPRRAKILAVAADARHRGWWEKNAEEIGPRQALYADLEADAKARVAAAMGRTDFPASAQSINRSVEVRTVGVHSAH